VRATPPLRDVVHAIEQILASGQRAALATVVRVSGSAPQQPGARLLLRADGSTVGTVGGGAMEHRVLEILREVLQSGDAQLVMHELGHDLAMCCGGRMQVFVEAIAAAPRLLVFGAGHVAKATAKLARDVGFEVIVVDDREELLTAERFPGCKLESIDPLSLLRRTPVGRQDFLLIVTHDHQLDEQVLGLALQQQPRYIGMVGSRRKVFRIVQRLTAKHGPLDLERVYAPVGLELGANSPDEIAVSILAELIAVRSGKPVPHMRALGDPRLDGTLRGRRPDGCDRLAARVRSDLERLSYPQRAWLTPRVGARGEPIYDVIIVGAGQGGLATAFGLMRERVGNLLVIDRNPLDRAGPWLNFARMRSLRTPKHLTGPDLGIPSLTPRAFFEARDGADAWNALGFIPREGWAEYLAWYRKTLEIPVRAETSVGALQWSDAERAWLVPCASGSQPPEELLRARRVVLATGIEGSGQWYIPAMIRAALPLERYAHTHAPIDFAALAGKRVAVLGAGASAFDNAATALEHGAAEVSLCFRRERLVDVNPYRWAEFVGFLKHLGDLPDADKWRFIVELVRMGQLPPADTYQRATALPGFRLRAGCDWQALEMRGDCIAITTPAGTLECDFVIAGTGFVTDLSMRPELRELEPKIARWADRYTPPEHERHEDLARHPYLGPNFEYTEREPGSAPYLAHLYNYTFGGLPSLGFGGGSISGMKYSLPRLVGGVTGSLFAEDRASHFASLRAFADKEF
jgi:xanthine/CO dehydrogenase XdhC/CoxF family maturation factor/cation diffusion facilitator CzcD-associated flavoprotein CzcO